MLECPAYTEIREEILLNPTPVAPLIQVEDVFSQIEPNKIGKYLKTASLHRDKLIEELETKFFLSQTLNEQGHMDIWRKLKIN